MDNLVAEEDRDYIGEVFAKLRNRGIRASYKAYAPGRHAVPSAIISTRGGQSDIIRPTSKVTLDAQEQSKTFVI